MHVREALGSQTHELPPLQIGFNKAHPPCGKEVVTAHKVHEPSVLQTMPAPQVPDRVPSP